MRIKKNLITFVMRFWWRKVDSNHRSETQQIYSLPPLATRELLRMKLCCSEQQRLLYEKKGEMSIGKTKNIKIKEKHRYICNGVWWRRVDLNHRSETQQIYSLPPLATRELLHIKLWSW